MPLTIRTFQSGDEEKQTAIYNAAAKSMPGFKPATSVEVARRTRSNDFDPASRFYAVEGNEVIGYCTIQANGRIGYPWSLSGHATAEPLLAAALAACKERGMARVFAAYRADWTSPIAFFENNGFAKARDMINFTQNLLDLPTMVVRRGLNVSPLKPEDISAVTALAPSVLRIVGDRLANYFFQNRYFSPESVFVLRRNDETPQGVGILIDRSDYANPLQIDAAAPCFRLGAFGTEELSTKRINGLFSFIVRDDADATPLGLDMLSHALTRLRDDTVEVLAAQVPSDAKYLLGFYQKFFRKQGSFPVFERNL